MQYFPKLNEIMTGNYSFLNLEKIVIILMLSLLTLLFIAIITDAAFSVLFAFLTVDGLHIDEIIYYKISSRKCQKANVWEMFLLGDN